MDRIIVFGVGGLFKAFESFIYSKYSIIAVSDNNEKLHGSIISNLSVIPPVDILKTSFDAILVTSMYFYEIKNQLITMGVSELIIRNVYDDPSIREFVAKYLIEHKEFKSAKKVIASFSATKKKLIIMNSLGNGGAERALLNLCKRMDNRIEIILVVIEGGGEYFEPISNLLSTVEIFTLPENKLLSRCMFMHYPSVYICNELFGEQAYDIVISYIEGLSTYLASGVRCYDKIACIHADFSSHHISKPYYKSVQIEIDSYMDMYKIIFVSESVMQGFIKVIGDIYCDMRVIGNIFDIDEIESLAQEEIDISIISPYIVAVGRLVEVKGFDRLIKAFSAVLHKFQYAVRLIIIGDGPLKDYLQCLISSLDMDRHIFLFGNRDNPYPYIYNSQCLISSSISEGHPLAVGEAIILGIPVIATSCDGNAGMLAQGRYGYLCGNDENELASSLISFFNEPMQYASLKFKAYNGKNSLSGINEAKQWNDLIFKGE